MLDGHHKDQLFTEFKDAAFHFQRAGQNLNELICGMDRPSIKYRPVLSLDGDKWCALYGENIQVGVCGFGDSPENAMREFDREWFKKTGK